MGLGPGVWAAPSATLQLQSQQPLPTQERMLFPGWVGPPSMVLDFPVVSSASLQDPDLGSAPNNETLTVPEDSLQFLQSVPSHSRGCGIEAVPVVPAL